MSAKRTIDPGLLRQALAELEVGAVDDNPEDAEDFGDVTSRLHELMARRDQLQRASLPVDLRLAWSDEHVRRVAGWEAAAKSAQSSRQLVHGGRPPLKFSADSGEAIGFEERAWAELCGLYCWVPVDIERAGDRMVIAFQREEFSDKWDLDVRVEGNNYRLSRHVGSNRLVLTVEGPGAGRLSFSLSPDNESGQLAVLIYE